MNTAEPNVTIAVVPRERFSHTLETLDGIYATADFPFRLVCIDGGSPPPVRRALEERARRHGFLLHREEEFLVPNRARNLALERVDTEFVVFLDNDALVTPGWLESLVRCAQETGASIVGPLQLIGPPEDEIIHLAGADGRVVERDGRRTLIDVHHFAGRRVRDVADQLRREPTDQIEFHCLLARRDLFDVTGFLDEGLLNSLEYTDLCMLAAKHGRSVWFEPASRVSYMPPESLSWADARYFMLRWSDRWMQASLRHFAEKWGMEPTDPGLDPTIHFQRWHRKRALGRMFGVRGRLGGKLGTRLKERLLLPVFEIGAAWMGRPGGRRSGADAPR
jgi:GT2 family glycosyltransferase